MNSQHLVRLLLYQKLDLSLRIQVRLRPRVRSEWELSNLVLHTSRLQLLLSLADPCNFRVSVDD